MEIKVERFAINKRDFFTISTFKFNDELYANLRSLIVNVEGNEYKYGKNEDKELFDVVQFFLRFQENIDHINYISLHINEEKWFNTLFKKELEETDFKNGLSIDRPEMKLVLPDEEGHYDPEELLNSLCCIERDEYELDDFNTLQVPPIYKFFGPRMNPSSCHCVHFDIVVYILMKRFPRIRSDLTRLLTVELEIANVTNQTIEEVTRTRLIQLEIENERLRGENTNLLTEIREVRRQNEQLQETIDELYNMNLGSTQDVSHLRRDVGYLTQDMHDVSNAIAEVNERVGILSINNQKLNTVHDVFIIYFSESKPSDIDKRNDCEDDEIWLSTYNGQLSNYRRSVPNDAYLLYQIDSNRLDSFKFITENEVLEEYILDIYQRNIKIYIPSFHRFIDEINRLMNADGKYEVVRNLQVINERIKNNNRQHQEQRAETERKQQLLEQYNDLHININRYKRRVYAKVNENSYRLVNEFDEAYNYPWIYRYGTNGSKSGEISMLLLTQDIFTNEHDTRIRYE